MTVRGVVVTNCSVDTTVTGVGLLSPFWMTREPVTTTSSSSSAPPPAAWAPAVDATASVPTPASNPDMNLRYFMYFPQLMFNPDEPLPAAGNGPAERRGFGGKHTQYQVCDAPQPPYKLPILYITSS